jgi:hypothetical protein
MIINVFIEGFFSAVYLLILYFSYGLVAVSSLRFWTGAATVLVIANVLFFSLYIIPIYSLSVSRHVTMCINHECTWIKGAITSFGIKSLITESSVRLFVNLVPFLIACSSAAKSQGQSRTQT